MGFTCAATGSNALAGSRDGRALPRSQGARDDVRSGRSSTVPGERARSRVGTPG
jgi:hypothetical protein